METRNPKAPRTLAAALDVAIRDGRALLEGPRERYIFDAHSWHDPTGAGEPCAVCAAGAVMARSLRGRPTDDLNPGTFGDGWDASLRAIDDMRAARWANAFEAMRLRNRETDDGEDIDDPGAMDTLAEHWQAVGEECNCVFANAVGAALDSEDDDLAGAWDEASEFRDADSYRRFLDLAENRILPIVARCERETLAHAHNAG